MNYEQALQYINSRLRFGIKPGLERIYDMLERLGNPHQKLKFIHVAGTNGKGSTSTMIASALTCSGKRTGLYTSPYICDFRERMQINGEMISREELAEYTEKVSALLDDNELMTEFELITCIAFLWFAAKECDVVVLEVGLGGRFDATNVIDAPLCSVIMRIDLDHTAILGDTVAQIASEKAGIIKKGCPVVMYPDQPEAAVAVIKQKTEELGCRLIIPDIGGIKKGEQSVFGTQVCYDGIDYLLPLPGPHQVINSITAIEVLKTLGTAYEHIASGIAKAHIPARFEIVLHEPLVIIDGAHNPNGTAALADAIDTLLPDRRIIAVLGVLADKDYSVELTMLGSRFSKIFTADGYNPRALSADKLCTLASEYTAAQAFSTPEKAFDAALDEINPNDAIIVCGSLYLAGHLRGYIIDKLNSK